MILAGILAGICTGSQGRALAAAPAPSSYAGVEKVISTVRQSWTQPGAPLDPNSPGWEAIFDALLNDLREYSRAASSEVRLGPLNRIYQVSTALAPVPWAPAQELREALRQWLRPRVRLAWAERRLGETVRNLPPTNDPSVSANRQRWVDFVDDDLGQALTRYNSAASVTQRQAALASVHRSLRALQGRNQDRPWQPAWDLQNAVNDLFNQPNLDITADVSIVSPIFDQNLVTSGPVYRKGYWSQVTAGPKTGFGLLPSDDGVAFYNSQMLTSVTPITDFQNQIAQDPQGQRAAKLYYFTATTIDQAQLTVYTALRATGLALAPAYNHNIDAQICSFPTEGGGFGRMVASLIGMNQNRINDRVYDGAIGQFRQQIPQEAMEEAQERISGEQARRNADLARFLIGNNMLAIQDFLVTGLSLRSQPSAVYVGGLLQARTGDRQRGADAPQPARLAVPDPGLTADVHLTSVLSSVADGLFQRPDVQSVQNMMIQTHDVPADSPASSKATVTRNVDYPTYLKAVEAADKAKNPKVIAIRVTRPPQAPEFGVDARGFLVALIRDVQLDVPAPDRSSQAGSMVGADAKVLRARIPELEVAFSYQPDQSQPGTNRIKAKVEDFTPSPSSQVLGIGNDEAKATPLNRFGGALVLSMLGVRLKNQPPIDVDLNRLNLRGMAIQSVSPLDPSGWVRVTLARTAAPAPGVVAESPSTTSEAPAAIAAAPAAAAPAEVSTVATPVQAAIVPVQAVAPQP
jgi:hypothetical protein